MLAGGKVSCQSVAYELKKLKIDSPEPFLASRQSYPADLSVKRVCAKRSVRSGLDNTEDLEFVKNFDWDGDLKIWEEQKSKSFNPISALFGQVVNCPGLTINFHGPVNYKA